MDLGPIRLGLAPLALPASRRRRTAALPARGRSASPATASSGRPPRPAPGSARTVLRARLSERAIGRSLAPPSCFRRRISRTRRIDTLSAGIGPPLVVPDEQSAVHRPAVERLPPPRGWPTSDRNGRHHIGISGRLHPGIAWPTSPGIRRSGDVAPSARSLSSACTRCTVSGASDPWAVSAGLVAPCSRASN